MYKTLFHFCIETCYASIVMENVLILFSVFCLVYLFSPLLAKSAFSEDKGISTIYQLCYVDSIITLFTVVS